MPAIGTSASLTVDTARCTTMAAVLCALSSAACGGSAGRASDGGGSERDGPGSDSGTDAGARTDAGSGGLDAGRTDAGADAGSDAGPVEEADLIADLEACDAFVPVPSFWRGRRDRDVEFLAFGDPHYTSSDPRCDRGARDYRADQNALMISTLNGIAGARWPVGLGFRREGEALAMVRGVLVAGDLTENGSAPSPPRPASAPGCGEYRAFREAYGLCGDRDLRWPVYEGFGNHEFPFRSTADELDDHHHVLGYIDRRTPHRPNVTPWSPPDGSRGHYSWDWDDIHFVSLGVKPAGTTGDPHVEVIDQRDAGVDAVRRIDPHAALDFLDADLGAHLTGTRQIVIMAHYGPSNDDRLPPEERDALCALLVRHRARLVAWVQGHTHKSDTYQWTCDGVATRVLNVGSPQYANPDVAGRLHFAMVRIGDNWLEAVDVSVLASAPTTYEIPGHAFTNTRSDRSENPDGLWGGWWVRDPILPPP